ncbi:hypothetical protein F183_A07100 [Bryobacterales bacterium F-183]|nr:hypothetical protein F183_A07100 [Bryobacterales bacterium F-183]
MNSSTGVDGAYNHSTGVSTAYTANYTNITASQDPLNAIFSWTNNTTSSSNTAVTTNNFINVWSGLSNSTPTTTTTNNAASGLFINASDYSGYSNVSSFVPTNTGGSTPIMGGSTSTNSYEAYLAMIYGISYGSTPAPVNNSVVIPNADPIPEPASILTMGVGVAGLAVMAYRRRKNAAR